MRCLVTPFAGSFSRPFSLGGAITRYGTRRGDRTIGGRLGRSDSRSQEMVKSRKSHNFYFTQPLPGPCVLIEMF